MAYTSYMTTGAIGAVVGIIIALVILFIKNHNE